MLFLSFLNFLAADTLGANIFLGCLPGYFDPDLLQVNMETPVAGFVGMAYFVTGCRVFTANCAFD
jgi:hypothetical protein